MFHRHLHTTQLSKFLTLETHARLISTFHPTHCSIQRRTAHPLHEQLAAQVRRVSTGGNRAGPIERQKRKKKKSNLEKEKMHQERFLRKQQMIFDHVYTRQKRRELIEDIMAATSSGASPNTAATAPQAVDSATQLDNILHLQDDIYQRYDDDDDHFDLVDEETLASGRDYVPLRVVIIGRPNVGKSTLLNRISGRYHAIVHSMPGVTRDIQEAPVKVNRHFLRGYPDPVVDPQLWENVVVRPDSKDETLSSSPLLPALQSPAKEFVIIDTPGADNIDKILYQTELALQSAHLAILVTDRREGLTEWDRRIGQFLLRYRKNNDDPHSTIPVVHFLNKFDDMFQLEIGNDDTLRDMIYDYQNEDEEADNDDFDDIFGTQTGLDDPRFETFFGETNTEGDIPTLKDVLLENQLPGLGLPVPISAEHNFGTNAITRIIRPFHVRHWARANLRRAAFADRKILESLERTEAEATLDENDTVEKKFDEEENDADDGKTIRIAIIGKPNVGKSTLINQLIGKDRLVTSPIAGTTRDTIELKCTLNFEKDSERTIFIADTAGMISRRRQYAMAKTDSHQSRVDRLTNEDTLRAIKYANVVCLVVDASLNEQQHYTSLTQEELDIAAMVEREGRGLVLVANKWDLVKEPYMVAQDLETKITQSLSQISGLSVVVTSSTMRTNLKLLMRKVVECYDRWRVRIPTSRLNKFIQQYIATRQHQIPVAFPKVHYMTQIKSKPPTFFLFYRGGEFDPSTGTHIFPAPYLRQLTNAIRDEFNLGGVPMRVIARSGSEQKRRKQDEQEALEERYGPTGMDKKRRSPKRPKRRIRKKMQVSKY